MFSFLLNFLFKNLCLIIFALIAPITLPAGGIQKNLNQNKFSNNTNEIILSSNASLYSFPEIYAKELLVLEIGTPLSVLQNWRDSESNSVHERVQEISDFSHPFPIPKKDSTISTFNFRRF